LRQGRLQQLTEDHSVVGALLRMGHITEEEAREHPQRNEILRAIGTQEQVDVEISCLEVQPGDRYLLCSDGLSGMVTDSEIARVLGQCEPATAVHELVGMANENGGTDNITVQIATVPEAGPSQHAITETVPIADVEDGNRRTLLWWAVGLGILAFLGWVLLSPP